MSASLLVLVLSGPPDAGASAATSKPGEFGTVEAVTTDSQVQVEPEPEPVEESGPRQEIGGRLEVGFGQSDVENAEGFDHLGMRLAGTLQWFPYVTPRQGVFGIGVELGYAYQGMNRRELPTPPEGVTLERSKFQQHFVGIGLPLLLRPHPKWFSIQPSGQIGLAFLTANDLYVGDRFAERPSRSRSFAAAGTLALCTAMDVICAVGGYLWVGGLPANDRSGSGRFLFGSDTWHVGIALDALRMLAFFNAEPA